VEFTEEAIEERQRTVARERGFSLEDHLLVIYGVCSDCRS